MTTEHCNITESPCLSFHINVTHDLHDQVLMRKSIYPVAQCATIGYEAIFTGKY